MHHPELILTLTGGLSAALVLGYLTHRLGLSPIVGYLLAGIVVGGYTPGFKADPHLAKQLSEIGVILIMFGVGLHFHIDELLAVRRIALPGAVFQSAVATGLGAVAAWAFGWGWTAGAVFGLSLSVASTVVLVRVLSDNNELHTPTGHIAVGWLVVEDLFTVLVLVMLPVMFVKGEDGGGNGLAAALGLAVLKLGLLIAVALPIGGRRDPVALEQSRRNRLARALHSHGAGSCAGDRGWVVALLRRVGRSSARSLPASSSPGAISASGPPTMLSRCATPSRSSSSSRLA